MTSGSRLGEPEPGWSSHLFVYRLYSPDSSYRWKSLIILFDDDGFAERTMTMNPMHVSP